MRENAGHNKNMDATFLNFYRDEYGVKLYTEWVSVNLSIIFGSIIHCRVFNIKSWGTKGYK